MKLNHLQKNQCMNGSKILNPKYDEKGIFIKSYIDFPRDELIRAN